MTQVQKMMTVCTDHITFTSGVLRRRFRVLAGVAVCSLSLMANVTAVSAAETALRSEKESRQAGTIHARTIREQGCMTASELLADKIRFIQTQMMVAALQCRRSGAGALPKIYNDYVKENRLDLLESERRLSHYLKRQKQGTLSAYLTDLANRVSLESIGMPNFCGKMKVAGEMVLTMKKSEPIIPVLPVSYRQPQKSCAGKTVTGAAE